MNAEWLQGSLWIAQEGTTAGGAPPGPALPGETPVQGQPSQGPGAPTGPTRGPSGLEFLWPMVAVIVVIVLLSSMTGRKEKKRREAMLRDLSKGDRIQTLGGIIGTVTELSDQEMVLRVDEASNTRIRFSRAAVQQVLKSSRDKGEAKPAEPPQIETRPAATPARV